MTNVLVVFTGGTIGSTALNGTINTNKKQGFKLLELFKNNYPDTPQFHFKTIQPIQLLSENLFPSIWEKLIRAIEAENIEQYDGIIVTHGTDTLAFTAAALGLYFNQINIPLLLVSSDYPLDNPQANGLINFNCALQFILQKKEKGVFVPYKNQNEQALVHIATRLSSCLPLSGDFMSVQSKAYLQFQNNSFQLLNLFRSPDTKPAALSPYFSKKILLIKPYPGLDYSHFQLDQVDGIIHDLYHSGTACATLDWGKDYSLSAFIEKCNRHNIGFYMAPAVKTAEVYDSTRALQNQGAKMIWGMSLESAYVKLLLGYGNFNEDSIDQFLDADIALEHI